MSTLSSRLLVISGLLYIGSCYADGMPSSKPGLMPSLQTLIDTTTHTAATQQAIATQTPQTINLGPHTLKDLQVAGPINVRLTNNRRQSVVLKGSPATLNQLTEQITRSRLSIRNDSSQSITLTLGGGALNHLDIDNSMVRATHYQTQQPIYITLHGKAHLMLSGMINLKELNASDEANAHILWVNSTHLNIQANGHSHLNLAGHVKETNIRLSNAANLQATSLTVTNMLVQTQAHAIANVQAIDTLRAFAVNNSGIYYMNQPKHLTRNSQDAANILALR